MRIFVYGTLKPDYPGAVFQEILTPICKAEAIGVELYGGFQSYPALKRVTSNPESRAKGWLVEVDEADLPKLDAYEGNGYLFDREQVWVDTGGPNLVEAQAYFFLGPVGGMEVVSEWPPKEKETSHVQG